MRDEALFERRPAAMLDAFLTMQRHPRAQGHVGAHAARAVAQPPPHRRRVPPRSRQPRALHRRCSAPAARPHARAAADEPVRHPRPVPAGVRPHRRPDAARPLPRLHGGRAHPDGDPQPAPLHRGAARARISAVLAAHRPISSARKCSTSPGCSTTSPRAAAAIIRRSAQRDARRFCRAHGLSREDAELVAWLVAQHLTMSSTAQKQDITDPDVVAAFARKVGTERRLAALYLLTVADIRGTSPKVWNAWKAQAARGPVPRDARACSAGDGAARTLTDSLDARQRRGAAPAAPLRGAGRRRAARCGSTSTRRTSSATPPTRSRGTRATCTGASTSTAPVVKARLARAGAGLQVLVYLPDQKELFARICGFFGRARPVDPRGEDPHDAPRLRARHVRGARSGGSATRRTATRSSSSSSSCTRAAGRAAAARAAGRSAA